MKKKEEIKILAYSHDFLVSVINGESDSFQLHAVAECFDIHVDSFKLLVMETLSLELATKQTLLSKEQVATMAEVMLERKILSTKTLSQNKTIEVKQCN